jgi:hypothetical protein
MAVVLSATPAPFALRTIVVFTFALTCPGLPIVSRLHRTDWLEQVVLAIGLSLCLTTLVAEAMSLAGHWSPAGGMAALAAFTTLGALIPLRRAAPATDAVPQPSQSEGPPPDPWVSKGV